MNADACDPWAHDDSDVHLLGPLRFHPAGPRRRATFDTAALL